MARARPCAAVLRIRRSAFVASIAAHPGHRGTARRVNCGLRPVRRAFQKHQSRKPSALAGSMSDLECPVAYRVTFRTTPAMCAAHLFGGFVLQVPPPLLRRDGSPDLAIRHRSYDVPRAPTGASRFVGYALLQSGASSALLERVRDLRLRCWAWIDPVTEQKVGDG